MANTSIQKLRTETYVPVLKSERTTFICASMQLLHSEKLRSFEWGCRESNVVIQML